MLTASALLEFVVGRLVLGAAAAVCEATPPGQVHTPQGTQHLGWSLPPLFSSFSLAPCLVGRDAV